MKESFLKYLEFEKRYSPNTLGSYKNDLNQFSNFVYHSFNESLIDHADHAMIRSWIVSLVDGGMDTKSINRKIACLRSFYKFLVKRELIKIDPMKKIQTLKTQKNLPHFVSESEINRLLDHSIFDESFPGYRDKLILELLYGTGARLSEIINLKDKDVDLNSNVLKVHGKRNKERVIPFAKALTELFKKYNEVKKNEGIKNEQGYLIVTDNGSKGYPMLIYRTVKKYLNLFTTIEKRSPHVLRHTFATHLLNKGAELNAVKDLLGHSSLAATQVYTHNTMDKLKAVFDQAHPKA